MLNGRTTQENKGKPNYNKYTNTRIKWCNGKEGKGWKKKAYGVNKEGTCHLEYSFLQDECKGSPNQSSQLTQDKT